MKTRTGVMVAAIGIAAFAFAGCGGKNADDNAINNTETAEQNAFDYKVGDYVKLGDYKNLQVKYPVPVVSDEDVEMSIEELVDENILYNEVERAAKNGDYVNIDFNGTIDGEEFEGGSAEDFELTLGEGEFLEDFEKNILGKKPGETVTFTMTFPEEYDEELVGKQAEFTVTLNSVSEVEIPEYNDAFVAEVTDSDTTQAYEEALRQELLVTAQKESETASGEDALSLAVGNAAIDGYPQALYDLCYADNVEMYTSYAEMFGMEFEEFMTDFMGESVEDLTESQIQEFLVCQAIAEKEGFWVSGSFSDEDAADLLAEYEYDSLDSLLSDYGDLFVRMNITRGKAVNFLYENADVEEVSQEEYYGDDEEEFEDTQAEDTTEEVDWETE